MPPAAPSHQPHGNGGGSSGGQPLADLPDLPESDGGHDQHRTDFNPHQPGGTALTITSIAVSGDFAETNNCGSSVAAGGSCTINVTFTPTATEPGQAR